MFATKMSQAISQKLTPLVAHHKITQNFRSESRCLEMI